MSKKKRAFLFYFDDWFNSDAVKEMDGDEECGYLRLLCYAWKQPDCGLPNNEKLLAQHSDLGEQWFLPTRDEDYRYDEQQTSGQKILKNFVEIKGRLYNQRLLRERNYQEKVRKTKVQSGAKGAAARWGKEETPVSEELPAPIQLPPSSEMEAFEQTPESDPKIASVMANAMANAIANECKLSLEFSVLSTLDNSNTVSNTTHSASDTHPEAGVESIAPEPHFIEQASRFQTHRGFNRRAAFRHLGSLYPQAGFVRRQKAFEKFEERLDELGSVPVLVYAGILSGLEQWRNSSQWERGAINYLANWLDERLDLETPPQNGSPGISKAKFGRDAALESVEAEILARAEQERKAA